LVFEHDENVMVPMSEINEARRIATEMLNKLRIDAFAFSRNQEAK
jgi:putative protease